MPQSQFKHVEEGTNHLPPTRNESSSPQPSQYAGCYPSSLNSYNFTIFPRGTSVTEHFSPPTTNIEWIQITHTHTHTFWQYGYINFTYSNVLYHQYLPTVPTHHFHNKCALMGICSRSNCVNCFSDAMQSRVRANCHVSTTEIIVYRTNHARNMQMSKLCLLILRYLT